MPLVILLYFL